MLCSQPGLVLSVAEGELEPVILLFHFSSSRIARMCYAGKLLLCSGCCCCFELFVVLDFLCGGGGVIVVLLFLFLFNFVLFNWDYILPYSVLKM